MYGGTYIRSRLGSQRKKTSGVWFEFDPISTRKLYSPLHYPSPKTCDRDVELASTSDLVVVVVVVRDACLYIHYTL